MPKAAVDQRIVDLFVANMLSFHGVESDTIARLMKTLNPSKSVISRRILDRRIVDLHTDLKQYLIRVLSDVKWVATTADCWSAYKKGYLCMNVHWLNPTTRQRQKPLLVCLKLRGHHTYDVLAPAMVNVTMNSTLRKKSHQDYHRQCKPLWKGLCQVLGRG